MTEPATLDQIKEHITLLPDADFRALRVWMADDEVKRREAAPQIEAARAEDTQKLWEAHPDLKPKFETDPHEVTVTPTTKDGTITKAALLKAYPAWKAPSGAHDAYPTGATVTHNGDVWRTDLPTLNVWPPEEGNVHTQWVKITDELLEDLNPPTDEEGEAEAGEAETSPETAEPAVPAVPAYKQPSGGHDAYKQGDRVTYNGNVYESTMNGNVWTPDAYPAGWKKL